VTDPIYIEGVAVYPHDPQATMASLVEVFGLAGARQWIEELLEAIEELPN